MGAGVVALEHVVELSEEAQFNKGSLCSGEGGGWHGLRLTWGPLLTYHRKQYIHSLLKVYAYTVHNAKG